MGRTKFLSLIAVVLLATTGCAASRSHVRENVAVLRDGGTIQLGHEFVSQWGKSQYFGPTAYWNRPGEPPKELVTLAPTRKSDDSEDSSGWAPPPPGMRKAKAHVRLVGNRVFLEWQGEVFASFDYPAGVAILGVHGQPEWAKLKTE
jgi:hypothetical protein